MLGSYSQNHHGSLRKYVGEYVHDLAAQGYKPSTLDHYRTDLIRFINYVEQHGIHSPKRFSLYAYKLIPCCSSSKWVYRTTRTTVNRFIEYLVRKDIISDSKRVIPKTRYARLTDEFVQFQIDHRGVCSEYAKAVKRYCECFFAYLQSHSVRRLTALKPDVVFEFITNDSIRYRRKTVSSRCSILRSLLTYLYRKGLIHRNLAGVVIAPRIYRDEACPRFISTSEVNAILSQINRNTPAGLRNYAMIFLLATYGLRGIEVIRLKLDDIDWHNNELHIRTRKAGNNSTYPLSVSVGEAILNYLQKCRPNSNARHVFLSVKAPYQPLVYTYSIGCQVRKYMAAAGIKVDRPGTHTFRYSCAQKLLDCGTPLKTIGDYLGHRLPQTTQGYTKIAINQLREVALSDGEELL